jgi:hypothetical protein
MSKKFLLSAVASTALAFSAFAANANDLTVLVGGVDISTGPIKIASEAPFSTAASRTASVIATVDYDAASFPAGNNLVLTFTLGGGATFAAPVTAANLIGFSQVLLSEGGGTTDSSVKFLVDVANADVDVADGIVPGVDLTQARLTASVLIPSGNSSPTISVRTTTEADTPIEGGDAQLVGGGDGTFIEFATAFDIDIDALNTPNEAKIAADFSAFDDAVPAIDFTAELGSVTIDYVAGVYSGFNGGLAEPVSVTDPFNSADVTIDGTLDNLTIDAQPDTTVLDEVLTIGALALGVPVPLNLTLAGAASASEYSATVELNLDAGWEQQGVAEGDLNEITREGSSYIVAWVASGTVGTNNNSGNTIRISNRSSEPALALVEVVASSTVQGIAPTFTDGIVEAGTVLAGSDLVLSSQTLQTLLGGDFRRADIRVIVEADPSDITVLRQVQSGSTFTELTVSLED